MNQRNPSEEKQARQSRIDKFLESNLLADYINIVIRTLIILFILLIAFSIFKAFGLDVKGIYLFPIVFIFSIFLSLMLQKQLAKIQIGYKIQQKYIELLNRL